MLSGHEDLITAPPGRPRAAWTATPWSGKSRCRSAAQGLRHGELASPWQLPSAGNPPRPTPGHTLRLCCFNIAEMGRGGTDETSARVQPVRVAVCVRRTANCYIDSFTAGVPTRTCLGYRQRHLR